MHSQRVMIFAAALCVFAMLAYLFVFAGATVEEAVAPPAATSAQ